MMIEGSICLDTPWISDRVPRWRHLFLWRLSWKTYLPTSLDKQHHLLVGCGLARLRLKGDFFLTSRFECLEMGRVLWILNLVKWHQEWLNLKKFKSIRRSHLLVGTSEFYWSWTPRRHMIASLLWDLMDLCTDGQSTPSVGIRACFNIGYSYSVDSAILVTIETFLIGCLWFTCSDWTLNLWHLELFQ